MQDKNLTDVKKIILELANHTNVKGIRGFADFIGVSEGTIYAWISRHKIADIGAILKKLPNARPEFLETGEGRMLINPPSIAEHAENVLRRMKEDREPKETEVYCLAGAGNPQLQTEEVARYIMLPAEFTKKGLIPVEIIGDSMNPVFLDGAIVGVDVNDRDYISGKYYAVWMDDEGALVKKLSSEKDRIFVESLNKNEHSFYVEKALVHDHFILGRVKWWINHDD